mmetsp:Transcript_20984/g.30275  ORF Transcript_20984/g.30275 Transcript_20984/m.30275 type:complete len:188 (-) Transcript_20984:60-623(-)
MVLHFLKSLSAKYVQLLDRHPLVTKSVTSGVIGAVGDVAAQQLTSDTFDYHRFGTFCLLQTGLVGPALHVWYAAVFRLIPGTGWLNVTKRVALDQFLFAPVFLSTFISSNLILMGTPEQIIPKLKADLLNTVIANNAVWIPAQFINLGVVPKQYQVLFANFVGLFWNTYLSWITFLGTKPPDQEIPE